jgi:hypothetical protein
VTQTDKKLLPSGNRIVSYDTQNCMYSKSLDGSPQTVSKQSIYYEVRQDSPLTDQQLQDTLRGTCEENISNNAISAMIKKIGEKPGIQSTMAYTITAISPASITVSLDPAYNPSDFLLKPTMTYTNFAKNLVIQNQGTSAEYGSLKIGDTIKMVVQDTSGKSSETIEGHVAMNHPETIVILGILKIPALTGDPTVFQRAVAIDLVRVEPCENSPTGFCRAYDFAQEFTPPAQ